MIFFSDHANFGHLSVELVRILFESKKSTAQLRITARMCIGASEGASGYAALRRAAPPHGPSAPSASGPRHIRAIR